MIPELETAKKVYASNKKKALKEIDQEIFRDDLRAIRENAIKNLEQLWKKAVKNLKSSGFQVYHAKTPAQLVKQFKKIVKPSDNIAKSKSNVIKESGLLKKIKNKVTETDCGDYLVGLCDEEPEHPVTPAITISVEQIVKKIKEKTGNKVQANPESVVKWVREQIRPKIFKADVGLTGANAVTSEGSVFILENEGNISLVSRIPEKHVIITSLDKIVESNEEAMKTMKALSIYGTGSRMASYVNVISGPSKTADVQKKLVTGMQGAREVHIIILDNGRRDLIKKGLSEALLCLSCGSCLYYCPAYQQLLSGFGNHYIGPKGLALEKDWKKLYSCTACLACKENCPVRIDVLKIIRKKRSMLESPKNKEMIQNIRRTGNPFGNKSGKPKELYCC